MSTEDNVVRPPFPASEQITPEEHSRRVLVEAQRLCGLAPDEWRIWYKRSAVEQLKIEPDDLKLMIEAELKTREKKVQAEAAEKRLQEQRADRERKSEKERSREQQRIEDAAARKAKGKSKASADLIKLPADQHEGRLAEMARTQDEDAAALRAEFDDYCSSEMSSSSSEWGDVEAWAEPVATAALLQELIDKIGGHVAARPHEILVIALWVMMSWIHEVAATHSAYLVVTSAEPDSGKTTTLGCVRFLSLKPYMVVEATGSTLFRYIDQHKPTTIIDEADDLFARKADVRHVFNAGWTRGTKIPRQEKKGDEWVTVQFDPFTPKAVGLLGLNMPRTLVGRSIVITLWQKTAAQTVEDFQHIDDAAFEQLRRKLARWSADNAVALKGAKPLLPAGFSNRIAANWRLLLAIAELADCGEKARDAAEKLSKVNRKPSLGMQLLAAIRAIFDGRKVKVISSKDLVAALTADRAGPWCEWRQEADHSTPGRRTLGAL
jgi:hypothetical protein